MCCMCVCVVSRRLVCCMCVCVVSRKVGVLYVCESGKGLVHCG